jgi:hypothetical protein
MPGTISVYLSDREDRLLTERTREGGRERSEAIRRILGRYAEICQADLPRLSRAEWLLCADALNGCWAQDTPTHWAMASIEDHVSLNGADRKWEVDWPELQTKLKGFSRGGWVALVDLVERFWLSSETEQPVELPEGD